MQPYRALACVLAIGLLAAAAAGQKQSPVEKSPEPAATTVPKPAPKPGATPLGPKTPTREPRWEIRSARAFDPGYQPGSALALSLDLSDAAGAEHAGAVSVEVTLRYRDVRGAFQQTTRRFDASRLPGLRSREGARIELEIPGEANGRDPLELTFVVKSGARVTGRRMLSVGPLPAPRRVRKPTGTPEAAGEPRTGSSLPIDEGALAGSSPGFAVHEGVVTKPDLVITSFAMDQNGYLAGQAWAATTVVKNVGFAPSTPTTVTGRLAFGTQVLAPGLDYAGPGVFDLGDLPALAPGESASLTRGGYGLSYDELTQPGLGWRMVPASVGEPSQDYLPGIPDHAVFFLEAWADMQDAVAELRENNNRTVFPFRYPTGPENPSYDPAEDADGDGWSVAQGDCDDGEPSVYPEAPEILNDGLNNDCVGDKALGSAGWAFDYIGSEPDMDGDGFVNRFGPYGGDDCNDQVATIHPGAFEILNGVDDDCDGQLDEGVYAQCDLDGDGHTPGGGDCNDYNTAQGPGFSELEDGLDNDCDGLVDESFLHPDWVITSFEVERAEPHTGGRGLAYSVELANVGDDLGPLALQAVLPTVQLANAGSVVLATGASGFVDYSSLPTSQGLDAACGAATFLAAVPAGEGETATGNNTEQASLAAPGDPLDAVGRQPGIDYQRSSRTLSLTGTAALVFGGCSFAAVVDFVSSLGIQLTVRVNGQLVHDSVGAHPISDGIAVASASGQIQQLRVGNLALVLDEQLHNGDEIQLDVLANADNQIVQDPRHNNRATTRWSYRRTGLGPGHLELLDHSVLPW